MKTKQCDNSCDAAQYVECELASRPAPREIHLDRLFDCNTSEMAGYFADDSMYDTLIQEDCDVYVGGVRAVSFRKKLFKELVEKKPEIWNYFRWAARDLYSTQRGVAAGKVFTTNLGNRISNGQLNFFRSVQRKGLVDPVEARRIVVASPDGGQYRLLARAIRAKWPAIDEGMIPYEKILRKKKATQEEKDVAQIARDKILLSWFETWFETEWVPSEDKKECAAQAFKIYVSNQGEANRTYSNVIGVFDRSARNPFGRLSASTKKDYESFAKFKNVYRTACAGLKATLNTPDNPRWDKLYSIFGNVKDENYNLFGTVFTTLTMNWNFRTALHFDGNNVDGGIAVLSAMTKGEYDGHYLVFPQIRCAFDIRDGDFLAGDNQGLLHGNTAMIPKTPDAERVAFVYYSRERVARLDDLECESCRKDFMNYSQQHLTQYSKGSKDWAGGFPGMWTSQEWLDFRKARGMERCTNGNYHCSMPYRNIETGEVQLYKINPGPGFEHVEVWDNPDDED
jgi:hypothetical protein